MKPTRVRRMEIVTALFCGCILGCSEANQLTTFSETEELTNAIAAATSATQGFDEQFNLTQLDPAWTILNQGSGHGSFALTNGSLRYSLDGSMGMSGTWRGASSPGWNPTLTFFRDFVGSKWTLDMKVTYNLHNNDNGTSTGAQAGVVELALGGNTTNVLSIYRRVDKWYGTNELTIYYNNLGGSPASGQSPNLAAPADVEGSDGFMRSTYWLRVVRQEAACSLYVSNDGITFQPALVIQLPADIGDQQRIVIDGANYSDAGSFVDYDYVKVVPDGPNYRLPFIGKARISQGPGCGNHQGSDLEAFDYTFYPPIGKEIVAAEAGIVVFVGKAQSGYGNLVQIKHINGQISFYAHLSGFAVHKGDSVAKAQVIGYAGNTGKSFGPHLHFAVKDACQPPPAHSPLPCWGGSSISIRNLPTTNWSSCSRPGTADGRKP